MKVTVTENGESRTVFKMPNGMLLNRLAVTMLTWKREVPFSGRQARKSLKAVKKAMREYNIEQLATITVECDDGTNVDIVV